MPDSYPVAVRVGPLEAVWPGGSGFDIYVEGRMERVATIVSP